MRNIYGFVCSFALIFCFSTAPSITAAQFIPDPVSFELHATTNLTVTQNGITKTCDITGRDSRIDIEIPPIVGAQVDRYSDVLCGTVTIRFEYTFVVTELNSENERPTKADATFEAYVIYAAGAIAPLSSGTDYDFAIPKEGYVSPARILAHNQPGVVFNTNVILYDLAGS